MSCKVIPAHSPAVFVHGLFGWGERDELYRTVPYWGLANGDVLQYLRENGYDCRAASIGALSSAWDRACELYAQLVGGRVDYGAAHAERFGHARWGITYEKPLVDAWDAAHPVDLVAHSFGGASSRLFMDILVRGRPEEVDAAKRAGGAPSPFFEGGKTGWVRSLSALAAPHNGSTLTYSAKNLSAAVIRTCTAAAKALGISDFKGIYDYQLDQFGICRQPGEPLKDSMVRMLGTEFLSHGDHALKDLSVDAACALNKSIEMQPETYYFSYPACRSHDSLASYRQLPDAGMTPILMRFSASMGKWYGGATPVGRPIGREWLPNDGLVNTISAMYPFGEPFSIGIPERVEPGIWYVSGVQRFDHFAVMGGVFNAPAEDVHRLYLDIMRNIDKTYESGG